MQPCNATIYEYFSRFAAERPDDVFIFDGCASYTVRQAFGRPPISPRSSGGRE